ADALLVSDNPWMRIRKAADVVEQFTAAIGTPYVVPSCPRCNQPLTQTPTGKLFCPYCHAEYALTEASGRVHGERDFPTRIVIERPVRVDDPAFDHFLVKKVLEGIKSKYGIEYELEEDDGYCTAILLSERLGNEEYKKLVRAIHWTVSRAEEKGNVR
ncbi:MAG: hypothetical protein QI197_04435, partial [Candidatus Korarchaeota archaeon]|nr:hypothetical protein [Candidatus Korarchaeota archaeon]